MKELLELIFFSRTMKRLLTRATKSLPDDASQRGFNASAFTECMKGKDWNHAARLLVKFGEDQENADQNLGLDFWEPLAKATRMMKMSDVIILCRCYRDHYEGTPGEPAAREERPKAVSQP